MALTRRQQTRLQNVRETLGADAAKKFRQAALSGNTAVTKDFGAQLRAEGATPRQQAQQQQPPPQTQLDPAPQQQPAPWNPMNEDFSTAGGISNAAVNAATNNAQQQIAVNRPDEVSDLGSQKQVIDPVTGRLTTVRELSQPQQDLQNAEWDLSKGIIGQFQNQMAPGGGLSQVGSALDLSGAYQSQVPTGDFTQQRQEVVDALYGDLTREMVKDHSIQQEQFEQQMANRGIPIGSKLYEQEKNRMMNQQQSELDSARAQAIAGGGAEQQRLFDMSQGQYGMGLQQRQQDIAELMAQRGVPLEEINSLMSQYRGVVRDQFKTPSDINIGLPDVGQIGLGMAGLQDQQAQRAWEARQNALNRKNAVQIAGMGGGGGGGGMGYDPMALQALKGQQALDLERLKQQGQMTGGGGFGTSDLLGGVGGMIAGAAIPGILSQFPVIGEYFQ